jgi:tRNA (uracil-5-)-methyltransferase
VECKYFKPSENYERCGSCNLGGMSYNEQLEYKINNEQIRFKELYSKPFEIIKSTDGAFRNRVEFRIFHKMGKISYAMNDINRKLLPIESCSIVSEQISTLMSKLLDEIQNNNELLRKIFMVEFLGSTLSNNMLVTLIYHRKLEEDWENEARILQDKLNIKIIGRSRKQKIILDTDTIDEQLTINSKKFNFQYKEGGFTQPNQKVNEKMIQWVINNIKSKDDLCELYCGGGNFTIPLSLNFNNVLATEISKTSIKSAKQNCIINNINNIKFIRMSSEEFVEARTGVREYRRLKQEDINLDSYNFSTIFVDPPRAGLDETTRKLSKQFEQIIYISCNPETLHRDLEELTKTHKIINFALFDQFAFSKHIESGVILEKK